jgi:hypothetical protein
MRRQAGFFDVKRLSDLGDQLEEIIRKGDIRHLAKAFLLQRLGTQSTGRELDQRVVAGGEIVHGKFEHDVVSGKDPAQTRYRLRGLLRPGALITRVTKSQTAGANHLRERCGPHHVGMMAWQRVFDKPLGLRRITPFYLWLWPSLWFRVRPWLSCHIAS